MRVLREQRAWLKPLPGQQVSEGLREIEIKRVTSDDVRGSNVSNSGHRFEV